MKPYTLFFLTPGGAIAYSISFDDLNYALGVRALIQLSGAEVSMAIEDAQGKPFGP